MRGERVWTHLPDEADEVLLLHLGQQPVGNLQRGRGVLVDDICADETARLRREAQQRAARAVADRVALDGRCTAVACAEAKGEEEAMEARTGSAHERRHERRLSVGAGMRAMKGGLGGAHQWRLPP